MTTTATSAITNICQIAEDYGRTIGLAAFEIDRIIHSRSGERNEWIIHLAFVDGDPLIQDDDYGAIIVVDAGTGTPRLIEGL